MNYGKAFGWAMVVMMVGASIAYAFQKDWRRSIYWLLAAAIAVDMTI